VTEPRHTAKDTSWPSVRREPRRPADTASTLSTTNIPAAPISASRRLVRQLSGKSHLARELGTVLGVTPVHLDGLHYDENWKPRDKEQFADLDTLAQMPRHLLRK